MAKADSIVISDKPLNATQSAFLRIDKIRTIAGTGFLQVDKFLIKYGSDHSQTKSAREHKNVAKSLSRLEEPIGSLAVKDSKHDCQQNQ